jgi:hypothetical protein
MRPAGWIERAVALVRRADVVKRRLPRVTPPDLPQFEAMPS